MTIPASGDDLNERMALGDPYYNYCWWPYEPVTDGVGKLRPSAMLFHAIQEMPQADWLRQTIRAIQSGIGDFRSVYGIKRCGDEWGLEVYIYDYGRQDRTVSVERLVSACLGQLTLPTSVGCRLPYFMFSFDLDERVAECGGQINDVHVYIGNPGSAVSSGISYRFTNDVTETELENFYFFFEAADRENIEDKVRCAAFADPQDHLVEAVLPEQLTDCQTICLANKRTCNTAYFSGINIKQLRFFLDWQIYPDSFCKFVSANEPDLDHLRFDVGVDYRVLAGDVQFLKSGVYGAF